MTKPAKKVQYKDYAEYLKSPKWKQVKLDYCKKEGLVLGEGFNPDAYCLCCSSGCAPQFHHFRYAKDWNDDTCDNLILVCETCHTLLHKHFDHDSQPITLRRYMMMAVSMVRRTMKHYRTSESYESTWHDSDGRFTITQEGINTHKTMDIKLRTNDQKMIEYFETKRDIILDKIEAMK